MSLESVDSVQIFLVLEERLIFLEKKVIAGTISELEAKEIEAIELLISAISSEIDCPTV